MPHEQFRPTVQAISKEDWAKIFPLIFPFLGDLKEKDIDKAFEKKEK